MASCGGAAVAPPVEDFEAILDRQLQDLRRSLKREHDRVLTLRESSLREEVARLRGALASVRASSANACEEGAEGCAAELSDAAATAVHIRLDGDDGKLDVEETCVQANRRVARLRAEATHGTAALGAPPQPLSIPCHEREEEAPAGEELRQTPRGNTSTSFKEELDQRMSNRQVVVNEIIVATQEINTRAKSGIQHGGQKKRKFTNLDRIDRYMNPIMCIVVLINAVMIGIATDISPDWIGWVWVDLAFVIIYITEVCIKLYFLGAVGFVMGPGWGWNVFDAAIIALAVLDLTISFTTYEEDMGNSTPSFVVARLVRLTRFGRILRLFQFEVFKELLTMLNGLVAALRTLVWAFILLFFPIYTLGLLLTSLVGHSKVASPMAHEAFGRLGTSMFLVFRCVTGDCALANGTPVMPMLVSEFGWLYAVVYVAVIMLVTFGIFNLIMATFVDNALETARKNEAIRMRSRLNDKDRQTAKTSELVYKLLDLNNSRLPEDQRQQLDNFEDVVRTKITKEVFDEALDDPFAQDILEDLDVPEDDRSGLFDVLDADGGGTLQLDELISGIIRLRGDPRRSDVVQVSLVVRSIQEQITKVADAMERRLEDVQTTVRRLEKDNNRAHDRASFPLDGRAVV